MKESVRRPVIQLRTNFSLLFRMGKWWRRLTKLNVSTKRKLRKKYTKEKIENLNRKYMQKGKVNKFNKKLGKLAAKFRADLLNYLTYHTRILMLIEKLFFLEEREDYWEIAHVEKLMEAVREAAPRQKGVVFPEKSIEEFKKSVMEYTEKILKEIHKEHADEQRELRGRRPRRGMFKWWTLSQTRGPRKFLKLTREWRKDYAKLSSVHNDIVTQTEHGFRPDLLVLMRKYIAMAKQIEEVIELARADLEIEAEKINEDYSKTLNNIKFFYAYVFTNKLTDMKEVNEEFEKHKVAAKKFREFLNNDFTNIRFFERLVKNLEYTVLDSLTYGLRAISRKGGAGVREIDKVIKEGAIEKRAA